MGTMAKGKITLTGGKFPLLLATLALMFTAIACSKKTNQNLSGSHEPSIVNGRPVALKDYFRFHTVSVGPEEEPQCTAVVVEENFVLTAAHCVEVIEGTFVHFGLDFAAGNAIRRKIKRVIGHPDYCGHCTEDIKMGDTADIAIVEYEGSLPLGFHPVKIAEPKDVSPGETITLAGFGANEKGEYETIMKATEVPLKELGNSEFSTDESKAGSCNGDSGGPAFIQRNGEYQLLGLTSRGDARCRQIGIYTMPAKYQDWILDILTTPAH